LKLSSPEAAGDLRTRDVPGAHPDAQIAGADACALGLVKKPVSEREQRRGELARLMSRYNRPALYEQVWSQPVQDVAKSYGISGAGLGKVCRKLHVPVPPRGYWARVRSGYTWWPPR
jgi:hypothetical protein